MPSKLKGRKRAWEEESSSSSSECDWRQEVWRRGFQGPFGPWGGGFPGPATRTPCWPLWHQSPAAQYQAPYHGTNFQAAPYSESRRSSWRGRKRAKWTHADWEEETGEDVPGTARGQAPRGRQGAGWRSRRQRSRPVRPQQEEEDAEEIEPIDPTLAMQMDIVEVPKKYIAKVIGKKGVQIRQIRDETGADVDARDQTSDPCQVKVVGTTEAIEAARKRIQEIIEFSNHKPGIVLEIPRAKIGKIIGIRGAQIHEIQVSTGAKVDVDKDVDPCRVTIGGTDIQIASAERIILTLAMETADQESEYLDLPSAVSGAVLGVKGTRLMELQAASGARIDVDKTRPAMCRVRIAGSPEQIELAKQLVLLATEAPRPPEAAMCATATDGLGGTTLNPNAEVVVLPAGTARKVIGRSGATIQLIQGESGARVWVDCEANQARISGQPAAVEHAKLLVQALVEDDTHPAASNVLQGYGTLAVQALDTQAMLPSTEAVDDIPADAEWFTYQAANECPSGGGDDWSSGAEGVQAGVQEPEAGPCSWQSAEGLPFGEQEGNELHSPLQPGVRPRTAMQRAFALLAARQTSSTETSQGTGPNTLA